METNSTARIVCHVCHVFDVVHVSRRSITRMMRTGATLALAGAVASGALFRALLHLLRAVGVKRDEVSTPLALGGCCLAFGHEPLWSLVMHGEPQLVGIALSCLLLERASSPGAAQQRAPTAALWLGLLFAGLFVFTVGGRRVGEPFEVRSLRNFRNALEFEVAADAAPGRPVDADVTLVRVMRLP